MFDDDDTAARPVIASLRKLSLGYIYDFVATGSVHWGIGGLVGRPRGPSALDAVYGRHPMSYLVFLQGRIAGH